MFFVSANQGQVFAYSSIAQNMAFDTVTITSYLNYLSQAFLVGISENYSTNMGKVIRKNKKLYIIDNGIRNALLRVTQFEPAEEGRLIENCAVHNIKLFAEKNRYNLYYWRDGQKEVDMVLDMKKQIIPIEIKYRNQINKDNTKGLPAFMKKYKTPYGIILSKNLLKQEDNIFYIPFWMSSLV